AIRKRDQSADTTVVDDTLLAALQDATFVHLHNHSQFSVLQSTISIGTLVSAAAEHNMPAVALTDHGNMMGAFQVVSRIISHNKEVEAKQNEALERGETFTGQIIKPIEGCEFYVCEVRKDKTRKDNGYQVVVLAKNKTGYHNLAKMASIAYNEGFYYVPRIDKAVVEQYKENLIVLSGNLQGEDRKSTRLNSSHVKISYAVFCLKK